MFINSLSNDLERQLLEQLQNIKKNAALEDFQEGISSFFKRRNKIIKGK